jgi:hypothetical protein
MSGKVWVRSFLAVFIVAALGLTGCPLLKDTTATFSVKPTELNFG